MESNNAPPHDFAPAWLKLPAPLNKQLSSLDKSSHYLSNSLTRKELNSATNSSFDSQHSSHSSRHYSFGDEEQYHTFNGHSVGVNVNGGRFGKGKNADFTSRRSNFRHEYREKSVPPHHSISSQSKPTNRNPDSTPKKTLNNKSMVYSDNAENRKKLVANEENCNVFNQEFPSLVDDISVKNNGPNIDNAWSNSAAKSKVLSTSKHKVQLIQRSVANFDNIDGANKSEVNSIINNSKIVISHPVSRNMSLMSKAKAGFVKDTNYSNVFGQNSKLLPVFAKASAQTTTPAMEILVKNPKMRANKSNFLKSIRNNDSKASDTMFEENNLSDKMKRNGMDSENELESNESCFDSCDMEAKRRISDPLLDDTNQSDNYGENLYQHEDEEVDANMSSSLEAEHRFLLELGWKQDDDPSYAPLTEDEVKEFKDLINARHISNGLKRNILLNNQTIHLNMSPKKTPPLPSLGSSLGRPNESRNTTGDDESSSSSEEDE